MSPSPGNPSPSPGGRPQSGRLLLLAVFGVSAFYAFLNLDRGWIPHDEGTLAHSAERVLHGDLPHRDYDEVYTGGLSVLNAVAFTVFGVNLLTPRLVLFAFFLAWVPALFYVATRFVGPPTAALAVLLAVSWSIPNYPAAMPSWYNLFFAVFGLAALLEHTETARRRWLFAAGLAGGFSILMKTSGLFFVAAGLLFLVYREQVLSRVAVVEEATEAGVAIKAEGANEANEAKGAEGADRTSATAFSLFSSAALIVFVSLLVLLVGGSAGAVGVVRFIVPLGALSAFLVWSEWYGGPTAGSDRRFRMLLRLGLPFVGGVLVPVGGLVLVYVLQGAGGDLHRGLLVLPTRRLAEAAFAPPSVATMWVALPLVALLAGEAFAPIRVRRIVAAIVLLGAAAVVLVPRGAAMLEPMWNLMNALGPIAVVAGVGLLAWWKGAVDPVARQRAVAVLATAGAVMLVQFPFSGAIYLFYALPVIVPAGLVMLTRSSAADRPVFISVMIFFLVFSVRWINSGELFAAGHFAYDPTTQTDRLGFERGGNLRVSPEEKEQYESLISALHDLSTSPYTYATPDVPEVYFLSGLRNPTRTLYEFFDDPEGRTGAILDRLDSLDVNIVVLNTLLRFSGPPSPELLEGLRSRYPQAAQLGGFIVRWREDSS